jgi:hypothetical protein
MENKKRQTMKRTKQASCNNIQIGMKRKHYQLDHDSYAYDNYDLNKAVKKLKLSSNGDCNYLVYDLPRAEVTNSDNYSSISTDDNVIDNFNYDEMMEKQFVEDYYKNKNKQLYLQMFGHN